MKIKNHSLISILTGLCLCVISFSGCTTANNRNGNNQLSPNQTAIPRPVPQSLVGEELRGSELPGVGDQGYSVPNDISRFADDGNKFTGENIGTDQSVNQTPQPPMVFDRQKAENIKSELSKMGDLSKVNVIVSGNTAVIGYSPTNPKGDSYATRNNITSKVKQMDTSITNVAVSESLDIANKIGQLSRDITATDKPANQIGTEFTELLKRITPTVK